MAGNVVQKIVLLLFSIIALPTIASANMLLSDLSNVKIPEFSKDKWVVEHQNTNSIRLNCTNCGEKIILNIQLDSRENFGGLGQENAKKAKLKCEQSNKDNLLCDSISGTNEGKISSLNSTLKLLDNLFIASHFIGDEKTLLKIRTTAATKATAQKINQSFLKVFKPEVIKP